MPAGSVMKSQRLCIIQEGGEGNQGGGGVLLVQAGGHIIWHFRGNLGFEVVFGITRISVIRKYAI